MWELAIMCLPILDRFLVSYMLLSVRCLPYPVIQSSERYDVVKKSQATIQRVAGRLIQEKKRKIEEAEKAGTTYGGRDLLSALRMWIPAPPRPALTCSQ